MLFERYIISGWFQLNTYIAYLVSIVSWIHRPVPLLPPGAPAPAGLFAFISAFLWRTSSFELPIDVATNISQQLL